MNLRRHLTRKTLTRVVRIAVIGLVVYALLGFGVIPRVARRVAESKLTELLHRKTTIGKVSLNPFTLAATVDDFAVQAKDGGPFFAFKQLKVDLQSASTYKGGIIIREITLLGPSVTITRETPLRYSFSDLLDQFSSGPPPDPNAKPTRYSINNIRVVDGSIDFIDRPKSESHSVRNLQIGIPFLSNLPYDLESYVQPSFSAIVNGTVLALNGRTKPFSETRETALDIDLTELSLPKYVEYVPVALRCSIPSGTVDAKASLTFAQPEGRSPELSVAGTVTLKDFEVDDLGKKAVVKLPLVEVTLGQSNLLDEKVKLDRVRVDKPDLVIDRDKSGGINLAELGPKPEPPGVVAVVSALPSASAALPARASAASASAAPASSGAPAPGSEPPAATFGLEIVEAEIEGGTVHFADVAPGGPFRTTLSGIHVAAKHFSTEKGKSVSVDAKLATEAGETIHDTADVTLSPLHVKTHADLEGLVLSKYAPYYSPWVLADLDDGKLDLAATVELGGGKALPMVSDLAAKLTNVHVRKRGTKPEVANVDSLEVKEASIDLAKRSVSLPLVTAHGGHVDVERAADGTISLTSLVPPSPPGKKDAKPEGTPWSVSLGRLSLDGWGARFHDAVPEKPATVLVDGLALDVKDFNLQKGTRFTIDLRTRVNRTGSVSAQGPVVLDPLTASLKVDAKTIDLLPLQPYFTDRINLLLTSGGVSAAGDLALATAAKGTSATYKGMVQVNKLVAVEKSTSEDFLKWDTLRVDGIDLASEPASLKIAGVALSTFYSRLMVNPDATLNLSEIVKAPPAKPAMARAGSEPLPTAGSPAGGASPAPPTSSSPMPVNISSVTLQGGTVDFTDRLVKPNFSTSLKELGGSITGLSSDAATTADLNLKAKLEDYAPLTIIGKVNPLAKELAVAIGVRFDDIDMSALSPYMGKYAGYTISKGKLNLDLSYSIANRKLEATNKVFIDQLTLGDSVDSPTATKLPVRLAIALLKDRKGEIHIDLPLKGSLDDPKFSIWGLVIETIENIVVKAATAPFALLGSLFGHGEDLSAVEFDDGRSTLSPIALSKVQTLVKALHDRPSLRMDLTGYVDPTPDAEGLRRYRFERKLRAQKLKELTDQGGGAAELDAVKIEPTEYARYLELAYKAETFPKPRNFLGIAKDLPGPEMEKLILTHLAVGDDDLRKLAQDRALEVISVLRKAGIAEERVFVVEPKKLAPEKKEGLKASRVEFALR